MPLTQPEHAADRTTAATPIAPPALDLHRLEQFVAVVETGSLTAAATRLDITQQALSVAIRGLENQVGVTLFSRGQGMVPSPAGRHLYESAQILLAAAQRIVPELRTIDQDHPESVAVGYTPALSSIEVLDIVGDLVPATAHIRAERLFPRALRDRLFAGEIDIALRRGSGRPRGLCNAIVGFNPLSAALRTEDSESVRNGSLRTGAPIQLTDLAAFSLILWTPESRSHYSAFLLAQCRRLGFEPTASVSRFQGIDLLGAPLAVDQSFALVTHPPGTYLDGRITVVQLCEKILAPIQALWLPTSESGLVGEIVRSIRTNESAVASGLPSGAMPDAG